MELGDTECVVSQLAALVEECRIVVVDDDRGTCCAHGVPHARARRRAVVCVAKGRYASVELTRIHTALLFWLCRTSTPIAPSRCVVRCYMFAFVVGLLLGCVGVTAPIGYYWSVA